MALTPDELTERLNAHHLTREQFDLLFSLLLEQDWGARELTTDPRGGFSFLLPHETSPNYVFTENIWILSQADDEPRFDIMQRFIKRIMARVVNETKSEQIVPIIRSSDWLTVADSSKVLISDHFAGELWIVYAVDSPDTITTLSEEQRCSMDMPRDQLRATSINNLRRLVPSIERHGDGPWYQLTADGCYEASILIFEDVWDALSEIVDGELVAAVPTRDVLLFTGSKSREGLARIRQETETLFAAGHHVVSKVLLRRRDGVWTVY